MPSNPDQHAPFAGPSPLWPLIALYRSGLVSYANPNQHAPKGEPPPGIGIGGAAAYDKSGQLLEYAQRFGCRSLVETGLYYGAGSGMPVMAAGIVEQYVAVDYQEDNIRRARAALPDGVYLLGDSALTLGAWLERGELLSPALFWLDAHAISDEEPTPTICPVFGELEAVARWSQHGRSVVLIDDVWGFGRIPGWPSLGELLERCGSYELWDVSQDGATAFCLPRV